MFYITHVKPDAKHYTSAREARPNNLHNIIHNTITFDALQRLRQDPTFDRTWRTFQIPKASGGMRTITAPSQCLKSAQTTLIQLLRDDYKIRETDWSFAYFKGRSTIDANKRHTENESVWFLKLDIKDFFDSITLPIIRETINSVYPTCTFPAIARQQLAELINHFCLYEGRTPQGGVSSPFLSNWIMVPFLYKIHKKINELAVNENFPQIPKQKYIITCYADDIEISAKNQFNWKQIQDAIGEIFAPHFQLKREKTHYGNNAGRNHMLGKVLNKDNDIKMGYKKLKNWKHTLLDICNEINGNTPHRPAPERQALYGSLNWDFNTQRDYLTWLIAKYEEKFTNGRSIVSYLKGN